MRPLVWLRVQLCVRLVGIALPLGLGGCGETSLHASERLPTETDPSDPPDHPAPSDDPQATSPTFYVEGATLRDRCGAEVVLRGVNEMVAWSDDDGFSALAEIAKTGANAARLVWVSTEAPARLGRALEAASAAGLVAVAELHDGQGDFEALPRLVEFWTRPETVAVVVRHERSLLVEIGGGLGDVVERSAWEEGYRAALQSLRAAGIRAPLVVHAPGFGNDRARLLESGRAILDADPAGNVLLAFTAWTGTVPAIVEDLEAFAAARLPVFVAEFSAYSIRECPTFRFDSSPFLEATARLGVGWFAWSWGGVPNSTCPGALDMTTDGTLATLTDWGLEVALEDPHGLSRTSDLVRPPCGP